MRRTLLLLLASGSLVEAQERPPISTDRPSESAGAGIVPAGSLQLETGYKFERDRDVADTRVDTQTLPDLLMRVGVHERFEARLTMNGWSFKDLESLSQDGFNDVGVGFKWHLADELGARPALSVLGELTVPVGSVELTGDFVNPKVLLLMDKALTQTTSLTSNFGVNVLRTSDSESGEQTVTDLPYTALVSQALGERVGLFGELYGAFALNDRPDRHNVQAGVTVAVAPRVQLDVRGGGGLVDKAATWIAGAGLSFRLIR